MRIYLDVSCLNRPGDDQTQMRIRLETEAVSLIMERIESGEWQQLASDMILIEINASTDMERRRRALELLPDVEDISPVTAAIWARADECQMMGFKAADAVHVAAAEAGGADVLLTCDDRMLRAGRRNRSRLRVRIENPLKWLEEQGDDADS